MSTTPPPARCAPRLRRVAVEVLQNSAMDCGPACLKSALEGHGIDVSYGRLREACRTGVDGTSIGAIEDLANRLGLVAEQIMLPPDHLFLPAARALPAILVVRNPDGGAHFVVVWSAHGPAVQTMDPAVGRVWTSRQRLLNRLFLHEQPVARADYRAWCASEEAVAAHRARLSALGLTDTEAGLCLARAFDDPGWEGVATLDAAIRTIESLARSRGVRRGREARELLLAFIVGTPQVTLEARGHLPPSSWSVRPNPRPGTEDLLLKGALLVRFVRVRDGHEAAADRAVDGAAETPSRKEELRSLLSDPQPAPGRMYWRLARLGGSASLLILAIAVALGAGAVVFEGMLFRSILDLPGELPAGAQRAGVVGGLVAVAAGLLALEWMIDQESWRLGRQVEVRMRAALLHKLPRIFERFLSGLPVSDIAERCHALHLVRVLPPFVTLTLRAGLEWLFTAAAILWLVPAAWPQIVLLAVTTLAACALAGPALIECDLRVRTHSAALARHVLDSLRGLTTLRSHRAESISRQRYESLLAPWASAQRAQSRLTIAAESAHRALTFAVAGALLWGAAQQHDHGASLLLIAFWTLRLALLGEDLTGLIQQYPARRNVAWRALEILRSPEDSGSLQPGREKDAPHGEPPSPYGVALCAEGIQVIVSGSTILREFHLDVAPGCHVAILGSSGAGKSTWLGVLLGWYRIEAGRLTVDGRHLTAETIAKLRAETAWVDPTVQIWKRSLHENLLYGNPGQAVAHLAAAMEDAEVIELARRLPDGMRTSLGEGGGLVSGGEGQRVRFARALLRPDVRLVLLDEAFRGLERNRRARLVRAARARWQRATMLYVTHDPGEALAFDRVVVMEAGQVVEAGEPGRLAAAAGSRFAGMLAMERDAGELVSHGGTWRRVTLRYGRLDPEAAQP